MNDRSLKVNRVRLQVGHRDFDVEKKLRRDLKRTHALLADAQLLLSTVDNPGQNLPHGSKDQIERLHCQVRAHLPRCHFLLTMHSRTLSLCVSSNQLEESESRRLEAESVQTTLCQELDNTQIELENICKLKSVVSVCRGGTCTPEDGGQTQSLTLNVFRWTSSWRCCSTRRWTC